MGAPREVRQFLRGLHRASPIGGTERALPLYRELVEALVDTTMAPTPEQLRRRAALLLANETAASALSLARLRWRNVTVTRDWAEIRWPRARSRGRVRRARLLRAAAPEAHSAIALLKATSADRSAAVFALKAGQSRLQEDPKCVHGPAGLGQAQRCAAVLEGPSSRMP